MKLGTVSFKLYWKRLQKKGATLQALVSGSLLNSSLRRLCVLDRWEGWRPTSLQLQAATPLLESATWGCLRRYLLQLRDLLGGPLLDGGQHELLELLLVQVLGHVVHRQPRGRHKEVGAAQLARLLLGQPAAPHNTQGGSQRKAAESRPFGGTPRIRSCLVTPPMLGSA
jgi:hypothetical protein